MAAAVVMSERNEYVCDYEGCDKRFKRRDRLVIHARTHTGERPFVCHHEGCGKSYCRASHLIRHQQNSHKEKKEEDKVFFPCVEKDCSKLFASIYSRKKHCQRKHSIETSHVYQCEVEGCGETFPKHHLLRSHSYIHTHLDPYTCSHPGCRQTFKWPNLLRRHQKIHQGYKCDAKDCEQVFDKWTHLRQHKSREHTQEYTCSTCGKHFSKRHWMSYHMQTHSDYRVMYTCPHEGCNRMYLHRRNLKTHQKRFHDKQRFPCMYSSCEKTFATKQKLKQHSLLHDPNRPPRSQKLRTSKQSRPRKPRKKKSVASILTNLNDKDIVAYSLDPIELEEKSECEIKEISESNIAESHGVTVMKSSVNEYETTTTTEFLEKELTLLKNVDLTRITEECENGKETMIKTNSKIFSLNAPILYSKNSNAQAHASSSTQIKDLAI